MKHITKVAFIIIALCASVNIDAQTNEKFIGIDMKGGTNLDGIYEKVSSNMYHCDVNYFSVGAYYEHQFAKYFRYNFGINYLLEHTATSDQRSVSFFSLPANIEFTSNILNFGLGLQYDVLLGANSVYNNGYLPTTGYDISANVNLSKDIKLSNTMILQPTISFNYFFLRNDPAIFAGVKLKYRLPKKM